MRSELTSKQKRFLDYLEKEIHGTGKSPSLRRAANDLGVSHAAISQLVKTLEKKGIIKRAGHYSRTIHLLNRAKETSGLMRSLEVPIIGSIAAGLPLYAQPEWGGSVVVDAAVYNDLNLFALKVKGESMKDAAILDGDLVICEPRQFAENGEIIVALVCREEATVKRFFRRDTYIELQPENPDYETMVYAFNEVLIQGKVIGVQRGPEEMKQLDFKNEYKKP